MLLPAACPPPEELLGGHRFLPPLGAAALGRPLRRRRKGCPAASREQHRHSRDASMCHQRRCTHQYLTGLLHYKGISCGCEVVLLSSPFPSPAGHHCTPPAALASPCAFSSPGALLGLRSNMPANLRGAEKLCGVTTVKCRLLCAVKALLLGHSLLLLLCCKLLERTSEAPKLLLGVLIRRLELPHPAQCRQTARQPSGPHVDSSRRHRGRQTGWAGLAS